MGALATLVHLGEQFTAPCDWSGDDGYGRICVDGQVTRNGRLSLLGSGVHGPVAALRALPGLGDEWGPEDDGNGGWRATTCDPAEHAGIQRS